VKIGAASILRLTALLATLITLGTSVGADRAGASSDLATPHSTPVDFEARAEMLVHSWFAVLGDPSIEANRLVPLLAESPFDLVMDGAELHDRPALLAWVSELRDTYSKIDYQLDPIRVHVEESDRYRVRFEFDRHALDRAGLSHVIRREHTWIIQGNPNESLVILEIEERPLLFFPGTGPQIVCY
jgi:hypothetical protein